MRSHKWPGGRVPRNYGQAAIEEMEIRDQLKAKRNRLFNRYFKNPMNTSLAIEIRLIDDRVAEILARLVQQTTSEPD
jgi:hypothetical protein